MPIAIHPAAGSGGFLLAPPTTTANPQLTMPISDLNPNIAQERARPRRNRTPVLGSQFRPVGALFALEIPLSGARPIRCTMRAASLEDAIDLAASRYPTARIDAIRELTPAEARHLAGDSQ